jgi:hypothetical protein
MTNNIYDLSALEITQICGGVVEGENGEGCTEHGSANDTLKNGGSPGPTIGF